MRLITNPLSTSHLVLLLQGPVPVLTHQTATISADGDASYDTDLNFEASGALISESDSISQSQSQFEKKSRSEPVTESQDFSPNSIRLSSSKNRNLNLNNLKTNSTLSERSLYTNTQFCGSIDNDEDLVSLVPPNTAMCLSSCHLIEGEAIPNFSQWEQLCLAKAWGEVADLPPSCVSYYDCLLGCEVNQRIHQLSPTVVPIRDLPSNARRRAVIQKLALSQGGGSGFGYGQ